MAEIASAERVRNAARAFRFANLMVGVAALCWIVVAVMAGQESEPGSRSRG